MADTWNGIPIRLDVKMPEDWVGLEHDGQSRFHKVGYDAGRAINSAIHAAVRRLNRIEREFVERRILEGDDKVTVRYGGRQHVYTVPDWRSQPIAWFKIWRARREYRRAK